MSNKVTIKKDTFDEETITLAQLRRIVESMKDSPGSTPITMTYVCSWFPKAWSNFEHHMHDIFMQGYMEGKNSNEQ